VSYFRSNDQASRNKSGSCLRSLSASARFFVTHALPSARQFAANAGSALIFASRMTLASTHLVLKEKSGLGSAARAGSSAAAHAMTPVKANLRANVTSEMLRKDDPLEGAGPAENYSAASLLWPSRALSLWINSSAASEITVPGGKIA